MFAEIGCGAKTGGGRKARKTVGSIRGETRVAAQSCLGQLSPTFQPIPKVERSVLIGVGQAATSVEITWEQGPDCRSGSTYGTSQCYGLSSGTWHRHYTVVGLEAHRFLW